MVFFRVLHTLLATLYAERCNTGQPSYVQSMVQSDGTRFLELARPESCKEAGYHEYQKSI